MITLKWAGKREKLQRNFYTHLKRAHPEAHKRFKDADEKTENQQSVQEMFGTKKKACSQNDAVKLMTNYVVNSKVAEK